MSKELLFSLTIKDFEVQTFRAGGKGGQYQNKTESGVRIIHTASGAVGEARDERSQHTNKQMAFKRCVESEKFKRWHKTESCRRLGLYNNLEQQVEDAMKPKNLKIEYYDEELKKYIEEKINEKNN